MELIGDLHIHSIVSDGSLHPSEVVKISRNRSISIISITDHNTFLGSVIASRYVDRRYQLLIYGAEVRTYLGDVLVLCPQPIAITSNLSEIVDLCNDNNCLLIPAHPYDVLRLGIRGNISTDLWDAIEVFNSSSDLISNLITYILTRNTDIPLLSNSDAHVGELIGSSYNIISIDHYSVDDVLESIRKGRVVPIMKYSLRGSISRVSWGLKRYLNGYKFIDITHLNEEFRASMSYQS
ncbi:MAG: PHP-associated domain-containing protein [Sulfolobales archaeon]